MKLLLLADNKEDALLYLANTGFPRTITEVVVATSESQIRGHRADILRITDTIKTKPRFEAMEQSARIATAH